VIQICLIGRTGHHDGHRQVEQAALFYEFSLERHVPTDHLLRSMDRFVDLEQVRQDLAPFYSSIVRPSIDPELMIRILLIGTASAFDRSGAYAMRSTSICPTGGSAGWVWMAQCRITRRSPRTSMDASGRATFLRRVFQSVLHRCIEERLAGGERFAVDASLIKADANRQKGIEGDKGLPAEATGVERSMSIWLSWMMPITRRSAVRGRLSGVPAALPSLSTLDNWLCRIRARYSRSDWCRPFAMH
jgi:transposase